MKLSDSIIDDEKLWFGYYKGLASGPVVGTPEGYSGYIAIVADRMVDEHRKRFKKNENNK